MASFQDKSYLSIKPGETKVLKKSAKILSAINYGGVSYTSTCGDIVVENALCYVMSWSSSASASGTASPLFHATINYIEILGVQYLINKDIDYEKTGFGGDSDNLQNFLTALIPQGLLRIFDLTVFSDDAGHRHTYNMHFQSIPSIAETIEMKISETDESGSDAGYINGLYVKPILAPNNCGEAPLT